MSNKLSYTWKVIGPILLSAFSFFISFKLIQPLAIYLGEPFNLLANRGIGKIAFSVMAIYQIILFLFIYAKKFVNKFLDDSVFLFTDIHCFTQCGKYFVGFFTLHVIAQAIFYLGGFAQYFENWGTLSISLVLRILFGFFVAFLLAWSEELIFRGMLYNYFAQFYRALTGIFVTSLLFMLVHDLTNPLNLLTTDWRLGLGLFLLGIFLNLIFVITGKLYTGIGAHMGLVAVKVFLRRAPLVKFVPENYWPFWVHSDLRQSLLVHLVFIIAIIVLINMHKKKLVSVQTV